MEEIMEIDAIVWSKDNRYYKDLSIDNLETIIAADLNAAKRAFVSIGFFLRLAQEKKAYEEYGYKDLWEYASEKFGISRSSAVYFIQINQKFSKGGCSAKLDDRYKDFSKSQLQDMLTLPEDKLEMVTPDMTVRQIRDMKKTLARIEIAGCQCTKVDEWTTDGDTYILGNCIEDNSFYYASVGGKDFEFDRKPTREEVESHYIDYLAMQDIDRHEAEVMGFCMSDSEAERKAAEAAKRQKEREREAARPEPSDRDIKAFYDFEGFRATDNINANDLKAKFRNAGGGGRNFDYQGSARGCRINYKQEITWTELAKRLKVIQEREREAEEIATKYAPSDPNELPENEDCATSHKTDQVIDGECIELPEKPAALEWPDLLSDMPVFARVAVRDYLDKQEHELREYQKVEATDGNFPEALMLKKKMAVAGARLLLRLVEAIQNE